MNHAQKRALAMLLSLPAYCFGCVRTSVFAIYHRRTQRDAFAGVEFGVEPARGNFRSGFDVWPTGADAVILTHDKAGNHVVSWHAGDSSAVPLLDLPATFSAASIAVHPMGQRFFIEGKTGQQSQILAVDNVNGSWTRAHHLSNRCRRAPPSCCPAAL